MFRLPASSTFTTASLAGPGRSGTRPGSSADGFAAWPPGWRPQRAAAMSMTTPPASHIHVYWPTVLQEKDAVADAGLWHVCPAHVFEARRNLHGQLQVVVNFENCIKCETCWRTSELVDWGRDGLQRFIYPVHSPVA